MRQEESRKGGEGQCSVDKENGRETGTKEEQRREGRRRKKHRKRMNELADKVDWERISLIMPLVFFKFSGPLMHMLEAKDYENIRTAYLSFKDY